MVFSIRTLNLNILITRHLWAFREHHYIFQIQRSANERNFRLEAFYKDYRRLTKTYNYGDLQNQTSFNNIQSAINVDGDGFAKGFELFWRDKNQLKMWIIGFPILI